MTPDEVPATKPEFEVVERRRGQRQAHLGLVAKRTKTTLQGKLAGTPLARAVPTAVGYFLFASAAELSTAFVSGTLGIALHAFLFISVVTHSALLQGLNSPLSRLLVAMTPIPLIRIVSLTSPLLQFTYIQWFTVLAVILYVGIVAAIKLLNPTLESIGLKMPAVKHYPLEFAVILAGFGFGFLEYLILRPNTLIPSLTWQNLIAPVLILYVATGLLEELLFRGLLGHYAHGALGTWGGIAFTTALFSILHVGWLSFLDVVFVGAVGFVYALVVRRTGSIIGVSISHGITNTMLFLVMPFTGL